MQKQRLGQCSQHQWQHLHKVYQSQVELAVGSSVKVGEYPGYDGEVTAIYFEKKIKVKAMENSY